MGELTAGQKDYKILRQNEEQDVLEKYDILIALDAAVIY